MSMKWSVQADGVNHMIEYKRGKLLVDGEKYKVKSSNWFIMLVDYAINFNDTQCRLVVIGNKIDLAVNGVYLGSGQPYEPISNIPAWVSVLAGVSCVLGFALNSWLGICIGVLLGVLYFNIYLKKHNTLAVILTFAIATVGQCLLGILVGMLLAGV